MNWGQVLQAMLPEHVLLTGVLVLLGVEIAHGRPRDGFHVARAAGTLAVAGRFGGREFHVELADGRVEYEGDGFRLSFYETDPAGTLAGEAEGEVDLTYFRLMARIGRALFAPTEVNYLNCL